MWSSHSFIVGAKSLEQMSGHLGAACRIDRLAWEDSHQRAKLKK